MKQLKDYTEHQSIAIKCKTKEEFKFIDDFNVKQDRMSLFYIWDKCNKSNKTIFLFLNEPSWTMDEEWILDDKKNIFYDATDFMPFNLPEKWHIKITDENEPLLSKWRTMGSLDNSRGYILSKFNNTKGWHSYDMLDGYQFEITTEEFKKYVLKSETTFILPEKWYVCPKTEANLIKVKEFFVPLRPDLSRFKISYKDNAYWYDGTKGDYATSYTTIETDFSEITMKEFETYVLTPYLKLQGGKTVGLTDSPSDFSIKSGIISTSDLANNIGIIKVDPYDFSISPAKLSEYEGRVYKSDKIILIPPVKRNPNFELKIEQLQTLDLGIKKPIAKTLKTIQIENFSLII